MYSISLLLLLAGVSYPDNSQAAAGRLSRRQSTGSVELWGACNYPSQGINGPLPCADGSECICKDDSKCSGSINHPRSISLLCRLEVLLMIRTAYAQCRQQVDGSWAPDPSWQCQQPGTSPTGSSGSTAPTTGDTSSGGGTNSGDGTNSGGGTGNVPANQGNASPNTNSDSSTTQPDSTNQSSGGGSGGSQAATIGDCTTASPPGGWDGVASTSVSL